MPDNNWQSYYGDHPDVSGFINPENPKDYDDTMKFSACNDAVVTDKIVEAGRENCLDAVRGSNYAFIGCTLRDGAGIASVTLKGSIDGWRFDQCVIGRGKTDIELGQYDNYWHPGRKPTRNGVLTDCKSTGGKPIRIVCWDATPPKIINTNAKIVKVPKFIWLPYFYFRRWTNPKAIK
jgi:hypothetical protein